MSLATAFWLFTGTLFAIWGWANDSLFYLLLGVAAIAIQGVKFTSKKVKAKQARAGNADRQVRQET